MLLLLLAAMLVADAVPSGDIWIRTEPDVQVFLDGHDVGLTSRAESGRFLGGVKVGRHEVRLEVPGGGSTTVKVDVAAGQTATVRISSLSLRAPASRQKSSVELTLRGVSPPCRATIAGRDVAIANPKVSLGDVEGADAELSVACGGRVLRQTIKLVRDRIVTVEADFGARRIAVVGDRSRVTEVKIQSGREAIMSSSMPGEWKRLIIAKMPPSVKAVSVQRLSEEFVIVFESRNEYELRSFANSITYDPKLRGVRECQEFQCTIRLGVIRP